MNQMNQSKEAGRERIVVTMPDNDKRRRHFPQDCMDALREIGSVTVNPYDRKLTEDELIALDPHATMLVTCWGTPQITAHYLAAVPSLRLIAHCAGTVAHIASEDTYGAGIPCLSANEIMAEYVAEDTLGLMIAGLRCYKENDLLLQKGVWSKELPSESLFDNTVGLIGLGTVGRKLLPLLKPFHVQVLVYDPYLNMDSVRDYPFVRCAALDEVLQCSVVSLHAAQTPETFHMIGEREFALMKPGTVFINTSRGSLVDTEAARRALQDGGIRAAFDVFEKEDCAQPLLCGMDNVAVKPHLSAQPAGARMTRGIIRDIHRFLNGEKPQLEVPYRVFSHMTQE